MIKIIIYILTINVVKLGIRTSNPILTLENFENFSDNKKILAMLLEI